jgi:pimeloyl-ACP methyl ester carboxylesterase
MMAAILAAVLLVQDTQELVDRYFAELERSKREPIENQLASRPVTEVEEAVRKGAGRAGLTPSVRGGEVAVRESKTRVGGVAFRYHLYVPKDCDPAKRYRLIVSLHGTSGTGEQALALWRENAAAMGDVFVLAPSIVGDAWGGSTRGHSHVLTAIHEVVRDFPVDANQVWMDGVSMGGTGTFRIAGYVPDRFAGVMPRVQGPRFDGDPPPPGQKEAVNVRPRFLENFKNVPVYWIVGEKDELVPIKWMRLGHEKLKSLGYDIVYREMPRGHEAYAEENAAIVEWMSKKTRDPYPTEVVWHSAEHAYRRAYWVEVEKHAAGPSKQYAYQDFAGKVLETRTEYKNPAIVKATVKRADNAIEATVEGAATPLTFWLSDAMLDLDKPVVVRVNGVKVSDKKVARSVKTMLLDAHERMDRAMIFSAKVEVRVP